MTPWLHWTIKDFHMHTSIGTTTPSPNFNPFHSTASRFQVTDHIETSAPNGLKMILNILNTRCTPYTYLNNPQSKIGLPFALWQPFSSYRRHKDKCIEWPLKWHWTLTGQRYQSTYTYYNYPKLINFNPFLLYGQPLPSCRQLWDILACHCHAFALAIHGLSVPSRWEAVVYDHVLRLHRMIPKWRWTTERSKVPHIHVTTNPQPQISLRFALQLAIFELQIILRQAHQMTPKLH